MSGSPRRLVSDATTGVFALGPRLMTMPVSPLARRTKQPGGYTPNYFTMALFIGWLGSCMKISRPARLAASALRVLRALSLAV